MSNMKKIKNKFLEVTWRPFFVQTQNDETNPLVCDMLHFVHYESTFWIFYILAILQISALWPTFQNNSRGWLNWDKKE